MNNSKTDPLKSPTLSALQRMLWLGVIALVGNVIVIVATGHALAIIVLAVPFLWILSTIGAISKEKEFLKGKAFQLLGKMNVEHEQMKEEIADLKQQVDTPESSGCED